MTHQLINSKLSKAIGWPKRQARIDGDGEVRLLVHIPGHYGPLWRVFDYRDWRTIGPIAQRYDCFPMRTPDGKWFALVKDGRTSDCTDTPQEAIALAVIVADEAGVLK